MQWPPSRLHLYLDAQMMDPMDDPLHPFNDDTSPWKAISEYGEGDEPSLNARMGLMAPSDGDRLLLCAAVFSATSRSLE